MKQSPIKSTRRATLQFIIPACIVIIVAVIVIVRIKAFLAGRHSDDAATQGRSYLKPVSGAYGYTLGDILPQNLLIATNDDVGFGLTYSFQISDDEIFDYGILILTEKRQIASIRLHFKERSGAVSSILMDKYGYRDSDDRYKVTYFGTSNRQAVLWESEYLVDYRDEALCETAKEEKQRRNDAADKPMMDKTKSHL
jgi:hypothetical protein